MTTVGMTIDTSDKHLLKNEVSFLRRSPPAEVTYGSKKYYDKYMARSMPRELLAAI